MGGAHAVATAALYLLALAALILAILGVSRTTGTLLARVDSLETIVTMPPPPDTTQTVYVDTDAGSDANDAKTPATAALTLGRALAVLQQSVGGALATVQLAGAAPLDLGATPTIQLGPLAARFSRIRIRGTPGSPVQDTVLGLATNANGWRQVTGTVGGYTPNTYQRHFVRNERNGRTYVVEQNGAATLDTIVSGAFVDVTQPQPPIPVVTPEIPWDFGDTFTAYRTTSVIQWSGGLVLDIPFSTVLFEALSFEPTADDSFLSAPDGPQHRVEFEGCRLTLAAGGVSTSFLRGSVLMRGVHATGTGGSAAFLLRPRAGICTQSESLWLEDAFVSYAGTCAALWFRYDPRQSSSPTWALLVQAGARFYGYSIRITEPLFAALGVTSGSTAFITEFHAVRVSPFDPGHAFFGVFQASNAAFLHVYADCAGCLVNLEVASSSDVSCSGTFTSLGSDTVARVQPSGQLSMILSLFAASPTYAQPPLVVEGGATLTITPPSFGTMALSTVGNTAEIVTVRGQLVLEGAAANYAWGTNTNTPLIRVRSGGSVTRTVASHLVNAGPTPAHVAICGANAIYNYQTTQNDFAAVGTQNCKCTR